MTENMAALEAFGLAVVLAGRGRPAEAAQSYRRALEIAPDFTEAHYNLANLYQNSGLLDQAEPHYRTIPQTHPLAARAACNLGSLLVRRNRLEEAAASFTQALEVDPGLAEARHGLARALLRLGRAEEAAENFRLMMVTQASHVEAREGLGLALQGMGRLEEAANQLRKVVEASPESAAAHANLGRVLTQLGQFAGAERHLRKALDLDPENARRHGDLGFLRRSEGRHGEAVAAYRSATLLAPDDADLHYELATALLSRGDFSQGWEAFEARLARPGAFPAQIDTPPWDGEDAAGRTLLVYPEQETGDLIQFVRYVPILAEMGARVILACPSALSPLLSSVEGIAVTVGMDPPWPAFDAHVPLMSLPYLLQTEQTTVPATVPYLTVAPALAAKWADRLTRSGNNLHIGIAWQSDSSPRNNSLPLPLVAKIAALPGVTLYTLQKGWDADLPAVVDLGPELGDPDSLLMNTAAAMTHLDLVISVDAPTAHLAGALARPTWILLAFSADWRWLQDRPDSPWYPTARLFRQAEPGSWTSVMDQVVATLREMGEQHDTERLPVQIR